MSRTTGPALECAPPAQQRKSLQPQCQSRRRSRSGVCLFRNLGPQVLPTSWRVDNQLGIGPSRQITGDWKIENGKTERFRYRLTIYTGQLDPADLTREWEAFATQD